jgi:hypothetical protein
VAGPGPELSSSQSCEEEKHPTLNVERPTSNGTSRLVLKWDAGCWMFNVGCFLT